MVENDKTRPLWLLAKNRFQRQNFLGLCLGTTKVSHGLGPWDTMDQGKGLEVTRSAAGQDGEALDEVLPSAVDLRQPFWSP